MRRSPVLAAVLATLLGVLIVSPIARSLGADRGTADVLASAAGLSLGLLVGWLGDRAQRRRVERFVQTVAIHRPEPGSPPLRLGVSDDFASIAAAVDASFQDVSLRVAELARDRARLQAILGGMVGGVLVVNDLGNVELVNDSARALLRLEPSAVGRRYLELIRDADLVSLIARALAGDVPAGIELAVGRGDAQTLIARAAPVVSPGGNGAVLLLHDISDLRRADRIRRDFVANVSHELRTPLTAIRGYVEALLDGPDDPEETHRFLEIIARHSSRMERLVRDLLRLARLDAGQEGLDLAQVSVEGLFAGVVAELAPALDARGQRVTTAIAPDAAQVSGDAGKLHDALKNLAENASNYSPGQSLITLEAVNEGRWTCLRVLDQGPGIPAEHLPRLFERFYRVDKARSRETGGTGLGLSIVRHLVELHGGEALVANAPGGGAAFTIRLPRSQGRIPADLK